MKKNIFLILFFIKVTFLFSQKDSLIEPLGFGEMNLGVDARFGRFETLNRDIAFVGLSGKMQNSVFYSLTKHKQNRFKFGDILMGELTLGQLLNNGGEYKAGWWATFRFALGVGFVYAINKNHDIGFQTHFLHFTRDITAFYFSGSMLTLRYRYKSLYLEPSVGSPRLWIGNFPGNNNAIVVNLLTKLLLKNGNNLGISCEYGTIEYTNQWGLVKVWNLRAFYGIYF